MSGFAEKSAARSRGAAADKVKEAEKALKSWFNGSKHEDAGQLYKEAGHQFKAAKDLQEAGDAYCKAAALFQKAGQVGEAAMSFSDAAAVLKTVNSSDAISAARQAIEIYRGQGRFSQAGRLTSMIAEMYVASDSPLALSLQPKTLNPHLTPTPTPAPKGMRPRASWTRPWRTTRRRMRSTCRTTSRRRRTSGWRRWAITRSRRRTRRRPARSTRPWATSVSRRRGCSR
mmetsp:Transcript_43823/g.137667  ORF Transcript_43823/g.137667 Transcript_43823/m.137667 type:complete len:229 (-) Transcript_43823:1393-2079(-)